MSRPTRLKETHTLPAGPLHVGQFDAHGVHYGWRPKGTRDWLLVYTAAGNCRIRFAEGEFRANPGDVILYRSGTSQDYGQHDPGGRWKHMWVHWIPRTETLDWLSWPELSPGVKHLQLASELRRKVVDELTLAESVLRSNAPRNESLALNAVERALLFCSRANPREGNLQQHPRIQQAADEMIKTMGKKELLENIAQRFGFSRSRFAALFRQQLGQPPGQYLEAQRLVQARHLLAYTNQSLAQIADFVGFSSPFYLSLRFKKHYGCSPRAFRQERR